VIHAADPARTDLVGVENPVDLHILVYQALEPVSSHARTVAVKGGGSPDGASS